jgi:anti-sigma regulatory factor (Ser/Thr protein kinase)
MEDLSLHILDVAENSVNAGAKNIGILVREDEPNDTLTLEITDDGRGMEAGAAEKATDPFYTTRTTRRVGMGLSLLKEAAISTNGKLEVTSAPGKGTKVSATFQLSHIDRKPIGNMADTIVALVSGNPELRLVYIHERDGRLFRFDTREIMLKLESLNLDQQRVLTFIKQYVTENVHNLDIEPHDIKEQPL